MELLKTSTELSGAKQDAKALPGGLPRLSIQLEEPMVHKELKRQVILCGKTKKAWINNLLKLVLLGPPIVKKNRMDDIACMLGIFRSLPMDEIRRLAKETQRDPGQMITHIFLKGLVTCASDLAKGNFD